MFDHALEVVLQHKLNHLMPELNPCLADVPFLTLIAFEVFSFIAQYWPVLQKVCLKFAWHGLTSELIINRIIWKN